MLVDAIDHDICPEVLAMARCFIARVQQPSAVEHLAIPINEGQVL